MHFQLIFYITLIVTAVLVFVYQSPETIKYKTTTGHVQNKTETTPKAVAADYSMVEATVAACRRFEAGPPRAAKCSYQQR